MGRNELTHFAVEMGSWDPALGAFTPTQFLGSPNGSVCATGFDQVSFIAGVSSCLWNGFNTSVSYLLPPSIENINL